MTEKEIKKFWEGASFKYQKEHKIPTKNAHYGPGVPDENELRLLGNVKGKHILELGCGGGQCSIAFAKQGAKCIGVDISEKQINFARKLAKKEKVNVDFILGSFQDIKKIKSDGFDIVFSAFAFQYSPNLGKLFVQVKRVLKKGGLFVFSFDHPFWYCISPNDFKVKNSYFKTGKIVEDEVWRDGSKHKFVGYFRKVSDIFNTLKEIGFEVEKMLEPYSGGKNNWKDSNYPKNLMEVIPTTIIFKARKLR